MAITLRLTTAQLPQPPVSVKSPKRPRPWTRPTSANPGGPEEVPKLDRDQIVVQSYVGGLVKSFERKAARWVATQSIKLQ